MLISFPGHAAGNQNGKDPHFVLLFLFFVTVEKLLLFVNLFFFVDFKNQIKKIDCCVIYKWLCLLQEYHVSEDRTSIDEKLQRPLLDRENASARRLTVATYRKLTNPAPWSSEICGPTPRIANRARVNGQNSMSIISL